MKFGGTSVGDPGRVRTVAQIVEERLGQEPVVVVSAHSGVTDMLISGAKHALDGDPFTPFEMIQERHYEIIDALGIDRDLIRPELASLNELLRGIFLVKELTPRTLDFAASFGERMSSKVLTASLRTRGVTAEAVLPWDIGFITDSNFGKAKPLEGTEAAMREAFRRYQGTTIVVGGFIAKNSDGDITTLGRGGSDYTASYLGAALGAEEIQIWTDVDGVLTANPRLVKNASLLEKMSFWEAAEVARFGGRVLHPKTTEPAVRKGIPIRVLNTLRPESKGTLILPSAPADKRSVKSIVYKEDIFLVTVRTSYMLQQSGFMAKIFRTLEKYNIVVDMIATSEVSVSFTVDTEEGLKEFAEDFGAEAEVGIEQGKAIVCLVGSAMKHQVGLAARVFQTVADAGVSIEMISQGANEINIAFVIDTGEVGPVVKALHGEFFEQG